MNPDEFINQIKHADLTTQLIVLVVFIAMLAANILYYLTLQRTMNDLSPEVRPLRSELVWLSLLPLFGTLWFMFYIVKLSLGLQKELALRQLPGTGALGVSLATVLMFTLFLVPSLRMTVIVPTVAIWLIHWIQMGRYHRLLSGRDYLLVE